MTADPRRRRLVLATAAAAATGSFALPVRVARAQAWPARQIRIACPLPPGGQIGCDVVAKAAPDGPQWIAITRELGITLD
jgi:tripartite-type tricarboxylate transporter receptor subunit TctC